MIRRYSFAIMTSVAFITACALSPGLRFSSSVASFDMMAVIVVGAWISTLIFAVITPVSTLFMVPVNLLRALIFNPIASQYVLSVSISPR